MEPLVVTIPHELGKEEAVRRVRPALGKASSSFRAACRGGDVGGRPDEFRVRALGQVASGSVEVGDRSVRLEVTLPWLLHKFARNRAAHRAGTRPYPVGEEMDLGRERKSGVRSGDGRRLVESSGVASFAAPKDRRNQTGGKRKLRPSGMLRANDVPPRGRNRGRIRAVGRAPAPRDTQFVLPSKLPRGPLSSVFPRLNFQRVQPLHLSDFQSERQLNCVSKCAVVSALNSC